MGNGPRLPFGSDTEGGFLSGMRARSSEVIIDETIGFIERNRDGPFFVQAWLNDTHATLDPSEEQLESYRDYVVHGLENKYSGALAIYYSVVTNADLQIGRLLARLDALGLAKNTVVVFSADNGPEDIVIGNASHSGVGSPGPFRGRKRSLYEGGVRTPFIVRWPNGGGPAGFIDDATPLCGVDLLPTFCKLAGVELPGNLPLDGEDMSQALRDAPTPRTTPLLWEFRFIVKGHCINRSPIAAIRAANWKLLMNPNRDRVELYDIPHDPMELNNRAERYPDVVEDLAERVLDWQATLPPGPVAEDAGSNAYPWPGTNQ